MNKFEHNGTKITLTDDGKFSANVNGEDITKGTLAAIKKAIGGVKKFEPFPAISLKYGDVPRKVVVTSISCAARNMERQRSGVPLFVQKQNRTGRARI